MTKLFQINLALIIFISSQAFSAPIELSLTPNDQSRLTQQLSKVDTTNRREEVIQEVPFRILRKSYGFLNERYPLNIACQEDFFHLSSVSQDAKCKVTFNNELSIPNSLEVRDGFMPEFILAEVKNSQLAGMLYKLIGNSTSPKVFFNTQEQLTFTHPSTGAKFNAFRLRIDCKRDAEFKTFECLITAVK